MQFSIPTPSGEWQCPLMLILLIFLQNVHRHQFPPVSEEDPVSVRGGERKAQKAARGHRVQRLLPALLSSHLPPELAQEG